MGTRVVRIGDGAPARLAPAVLVLDPLRRGVHDRLAGDDCRARLMGL